MLKSIFAIVAFCCVLTGCGDEKETAEHSTGGGGAGGVGGQNIGGHGQGGTGGVGGQGGASAIDY